MPDQTSKSVPAPAFKAGDVVHCYNGNDLYIGIKTITEVAEAPEVWESWMERRYYITPTDTPWYAVAESQVVPLAALPVAPRKWSRRRGSTECAA